MTRNHLRPLLALVLAAGTLALAAAADQKLTGVVTAVDADKGTITVVTGEGGAKIYDLKLAKDAKIVIGDHDGRAVDLKECGFCMVELGPDDKTVVKIKAYFGKEGDPLGFVKTISADEITLERDGKETTYKVSPKVRVFVNAQPAKLADVKKISAAFLRLRSEEVVIIWAMMGK